MLSCSILPLLCFVAVFITTTLGQRNHDCYVSGSYYGHNQLFSIPGQSQCIKYICWYGRVIRRIEACEVEGECHRVGSTFEHRCTRYRCNKIDRGHLVYYQPDIVNTRCRDFNGQCRREGETFPFQMHGRYYPQCTCTIAHTTIRYRCTSYTYPRLVSGNRGSSSNGGGSSFVNRLSSSSGSSNGGSPIIRAVSGGHQQGGYIFRGGPQGGEDDSEVSITIDAMGVDN